MLASELTHALLFARSTYLLPVPSGGGAGFGDAHTEAIDAAVHVVLVQKEGVRFTLVTTRPSYQILKSTFKLLSFHAEKHIQVRLEKGIWVNAAWN